MIIGDVYYWELFFAVARLIVMIESVIFCLRGRGLISDNRTIGKKVAMGNTQ